MQAQQKQKMLEHGLLCRCCLERAQPYAAEGLRQMALAAWLKALAGLTL